MTVRVRADVGSIAIGRERHWECLRQDVAAIPPFLVAILGLLLPTDAHNSRSLLHRASRLPIATVAKRTTRTSVVLQQRPVR
jgi:hypothetical protein